MRVADEPARFGLLYGSYKAPRELVWMLGLVIYLLMMATGFEVVDMDGRKIDKLIASRPRAKKREGQAEQVSE